MKISYNWLQTFFEGTLPDPHFIAERLTMHAFEVEGVEAVGNDTVFTVDVLPNRAHDCLSHYGVAREVSVLLELPLRYDPLRKERHPLPRAERLSVVIADKASCPRYSAVIIENITVGPSPEWLVERLRVLGQRSINNIVDATNYVMLTIGQPLHAFDLKKFAVTSGEITIGVRASRQGETLRTLDDTERVLPADTLVITDGGTDSPIGIAGIKGGANTAIDEGTEHIVIESANFDPVRIRACSRVLGLRTDASSRFEHALSKELTLPALYEVCELIAGMSGKNVTVRGLVDVCPEPQSERQIVVAIPAINDMLGTAMRAEEVKSILKRLGFVFVVDGEHFTVTVPFERLDLAISEDLVEEIGRIAGFSNIASTPLPPMSVKPAVNKRTYYASRIRSLLVERGFSEAYTYAFVNEGAVEVANPIASDKNFLRYRLTPGLSRALALNARIADLLGDSRVRIFEIGNVFPKEGEHCAVAIGVAGQGKNGMKEAERELEETVTALAGLLGNMSLSGTSENGVYEFNLDVVLDKLDEPASYVWTESISEVPTFAPISPYPFVLRDIALWVPGDVDAGEVERVIAEKAGDLRIRTRLFDEFKKDDRTSYAFRLVFQSHEKTLTDEEVGLIMWNITKALEGKGWQVR